MVIFLFEAEYAERRNSAIFCTRRHTYTEPKCCFVTVGTRVKRRSFRIVCTNVRSVNYYFLSIVGRRTGGEWRNTCLESADVDLYARIDFLLLLFLESLCGDLPNTVDRRKPASFLLFNSRALNCLSM